MTNVSLLGENKSVLWTVLSKLKQSLGLWNFPGITGEPGAFVISFADSPRETKILCVAANSLCTYKIIVPYFKTCNEYNNPWWCCQPSPAFPGSQAVALQSILMRYFL